jgi:hypothetical protein
LVRFRFTEILQIVDLQQSDFACRERMRQLAAVLLLLRSAAHASDHASILDQLTFNNGGARTPVRSTDRFAFREQCLWYWEPDNISTTLWAWTNEWQTTAPFLYQIPPSPKSESSPPSCPYKRNPKTANEIPLGPGKTDLIFATLIEAQATCNSMPQCTGVVDATAYSPCEEGKCFIARGGPAVPMTNNLVLYLKLLCSPTPPPSPVSQAQTPPNGMRSAVPLGGLGTGTFELRADGSFKEWTLENQSPAGGAKLGSAALDDAFFALYIEVEGKTPQVRILRTQLPASFGSSTLPGAVSGMSYEGAFPVSALAIEDDSLLQGLKATLYASSELQFFDANASNTPSATFTLVVSNPTAAAAKVSLLLALPLGAQQDTDRRCEPTAPYLGANSHVLRVLKTDGYVFCRAACHGNGTSICGSWVWDEQSQACTLCLGVPHTTSSNTWNDGPSEVTPVFVRKVSGVNGEWSLEPVSSAGVLGGLTFSTSSRSYSQSGSVTMGLIRPSSTEDTASGGTSSAPSFLATDDLQTGVASFAANGSLPFSSADNGANGTGAAVGASHGLAASGPMEVPAGGGNASTTLVLAWYYPVHDFNWFPLLNRYASAPAAVSTPAAAVKPFPFSSSSSVLQSMARTHTDSLLNISALNQALFESSLPSSLADTLLNTLGTWRLGMLFKDSSLPGPNHGGGVPGTNPRRSPFWREWETFDCVDTDPVECDSSRALPLLFLYPSLFRSMLEGFRDSQCPESKAHNCVGDGQIPEIRVEACGLSSNGQPDAPGGRLQGDATTVFVFYVYKFHRWTNDSSVLADFFPHVERAVNFTVANARSSPYLLPFRMDPFWDILAIANWEHDLYNSLWYILGLRTGAALARTQGCPHCSRLANGWDEIADAAVRQTEALFWDEAGRYYRPLQDSNPSMGKPDWMMADSFYAQMHAWTAGGIGRLLPNATRLRMHLTAERRRNLSPKFGMRILTCADSPPKPCDHDPRYHAAIQRGKERKAWKRQRWERHRDARLAERRARPPAGALGGSSLDPTPVLPTCAPDPYTVDLHDHIFNVSASEILKATPTVHWNMSACKAQCCASRRGPSATTCRAVALLRPSAGVGGCAAGQPCCLLYRSPFDEHTTIVPASAAANATIGWVMWRSLTPGECDRFSGEPSVCQQYSNANCHVSSNSKCTIGQTPAHTASCKATITNGNHDSIWGMMTPDWSTLAMREGLADAEAAMAVVLPYLDNTRIGLRNQWNWAGVQSTESTGVGEHAAEMAGQPFCTAHYFFHLTVWHLPAAISGQTYSAVDAELGFAPALQPPYTLPVLVPGAVGTLKCSASGSYSFVVVLGQIQLRAITMPTANWTAAAGKPVQLVAGDAALTWERATRHALR